MIRYLDRISTLKNESKGRMKERKSGKRKEITEDTSSFLFITIMTNLEDLKRVGKFPLKWILR